MEFARSFPLAGFVRPRARGSPALGQVDFDLRTGTVVLLRHTHTHTHTHTHVHTRNALVTVCPRIASCTRLIVGPRQHVPPFADVSCASCDVPIENFDSENQPELSILLACLLVVPPRRDSVCTWLWNSRGTRCLSFHQSLRINDPLRDDGLRRRCSAADGDGSALKFEVCRSDVACFLLVTGGGDFNRRVSVIQSPSGETWSEFRLFGTEYYILRYVILLYRYYYILHYLKQRRPTSSSPRAALETWTKNMDCFHEICIRVSVTAESPISYIHCNLEKLWCIAACFN